MKGRWIEYSQEELAFIEARKEMVRSELTALFNATFGRDVSLNNICALCKRKGWLTGRDGRIKPGQKPHPNARNTKPNRTSFKAGHSPHNVLPVGSEVVDEDGYHWIKIENPKKWAMKHRLVWEQKNGPIPKGVNIQFLDGNRSNCDISNLHAVTRGDSAYMNKTGLAKVPAELKPSAVALTKVLRKIRQVERVQEV